jgi:hypothetical protein
MENLLRKKPYSVSFWISCNIALADNIHIFSLLPVSMKLVRTGLLSLALSGSALFFFGCGSDPAKTDSLQDTTAVDSTAQVLEAVDALFSQLPRPSAIPNLIALTGAEYQDKLVNSASNAEKVLSNSSKASFGIGILCADVAYQVAYDKSQDALKTFVVGKKLADKVGVSSAFEPSIISRLENNIGQKDSLIEISDASLANSSGILKSNDQVKDAALLTAGAFVEGLYLTCGLIHDYPPTGLSPDDQNKILVPLVSTVVKQEAALGSLIQLLKQVDQSDEAVKTVQAGLEEAQAIYTKAGWSKKIAENKGNLILTEKDIHELAVSIARLRNSMVQ